MVIELLKGPMFVSTKAKRGRQALDWGQSALEACPRDDSSAAAPDRGRPSKRPRYKQTDVSI